MSAHAMPRVPVRAGVILVAVAVILGMMTACGNKKHTSKSNRKPTSSASRTASGSAATRRLNAADFLLTAGPATTGLTAEPGGGDENTSLIFALRGSVGQCLGLSPGDVGAAATEEKTGPSFTSGRPEGSAQGGGPTAVTSSAAVYADSRTVTAQRDLVHRAEFASCYGRFILAEIDDPGASVVSSRVAPAPAGASDRVSVVIGEVTGGRTIRYYVDLVLFFRGRVQSAAVLTQGGRPVADALLTGATEQLHDKISRQ